MRAATALAALLLAASPAVARMHAGPSQLHAGHRLQGAIAPLDGGGAFAAPAAAYSLRKLKSTYAGPAIKLRRASDSATQDINFLGFTGFTGAPLDVAAAQAFCNATVCTLDTWYDQSGNARHANGGTPATAAVLTLNCSGTKPCLRSGSSWTNGPSVTPSATSSVAAVGKVESTAATCPLIRYGGDQEFGPNAGGGVWLLWNTTAGFTAPAALGVIHAGAGVFGGASSVVNIDGVETTGTVPATIAAGAIYVATNHDAVIKCQHFEAIWWDNTTLTAAERAAVVNNQRAFWVP